MSLLTPHQNNALDHKKHISLTANAGSGKTFVLSKRYLEIAVNENLPLRNIAAITFTDKAAGELYQKIAREIDSRLKAAKEKQLIKRLETIRSQLVSANISTIHSFCINILREHPVEAGIDANFTAIDEMFSDELIEISIEELFKKSLENSVETNNLKYLIRHFSSKNNLSKELLSALKHRRNLMTLSGRIYCLPAEEISKHFFNTFLLTTAEILKDNFEEFKSSVAKINSNVLNLNKKNPIATEIEVLISKLEKERDTEKLILLLEDLRNKILIKSGAVAIKGYLTREDSYTLQTECSLVEKYLDKVKFFHIPQNHIEIEAELANFGLIFNDYFRKTLDIYTQKKKEAGYLDYEDILLLTHDILQIEDVKEALSEKFKYIMIDEYQDTNELQYNIFLPILKDFEKGNLFVVGDEKQSIYMFRDAELEIFSKTKNKIGVASGNESLLTLPDSFRMAPNLCVFINTLFQKLFYSPNKLFNEVEHEDVVCAREDNESGNIEILLADLETSDNNDFGEANLVAERILNLIEDNKKKAVVNWGDIAILCRKRKSFLELEKSFSKKKIPFAIIGGKGFYQRQSIYDIYNYFSFLLDQNDDTALIGILRSPFFSISDSEIFEISLIRNSSFWLKLKAYSEKQPNISRIVKILDENISLISKMEVLRILRKIVTETEYLVILSQKTNSTQELANYEKLLNLTIKFFEEDFRTLYDYVNFLKESIGKVEDESQAAIADELNSVKIMTIHQAKGLEFPIVFLYRCGDSSKKSSIKSKSIIIDKSFGILTKVPLGGDYFGQPHSAPIIGLSNYINERKNLAEVKRLFYVAVTRAKNQLFICSNTEQALSAAEDTFIGMLRLGLNADFNLDMLILKSKLKLLSKTDDKYSNTEKDLVVSIPIVKKLHEIPAAAAKVEELPQFKSYLLKRIDDKPIGEIFSATKFSVYNQCPLKYLLIYDLGFSTLMSEHNNWVNKQNLNSTNRYFDFNSKEEKFLSTFNEEGLLIKDVKTSQLKRTIIHRLLSEETEQSDLNNKVESYFTDKLNPNDLNSIQIQELKQNIIQDITKYFESKNYQFIKKYRNYKNEAELYHQHKDYFLFGIIDKLILDENQIIIVDYKTDLILPEETNGRAKQYFEQLKFYAYLAGKLYGINPNIELRLVFVKHPNEIHTLKMVAKDLISIENDIELTVEKVRQKSLQKNLNHCKFCNFSMNGECIVT